VGIEQVHRCTKEELCREFGRPESLRILRSSVSGHSARKHRGKELLNVLWRRYSAKRALRKCAAGTGEQGTL
jgi:hypothetical protein